MSAAGRGEAPPCPQAFILHTKAWCICLEERLQKLLSAGGIASRREAERYIQAGRVTVNGTVAVLGARADPERDTILVDGVRLGGAGRRTYLMLNKPRGYVTTLSDERGRRTVAELVRGCGARVWPVGRLDLDSEGLLLMTDDGALTHRLTHPSHEVEKEYRVWVEGDLDRGLPILGGPMELDGIALHPARATLLERDGAGRSSLSVVIHEGRNRQVRRMCATAGLRVIRLQRVREGPLLLGDLKPGAWRPLTWEELERLDGI